MTNESFPRIFQKWINISSGSTPWSNCGQSWNSECCATEYANGSLVRPVDCFKNETGNGIAKFPEDEYWYNRARIKTTQNSLETFFDTSFLKDLKRFLNDILKYVYQHCSYIRKTLKRDGESWTTCHITFDRDISMTQW